MEISFLDIYNKVFFPTLINLILNLDLTQQLSLIQ